MSEGLEFITFKNYLKILLFDLPLYLWNDRDFGKTHCFWQSEKIKSEKPTDIVKFASQKHVIFAS